MIHNSGRDEKGRFTTGNKVTKRSPYMNINSMLICMWCEYASRCKYGDTECVCSKNKLFKNYENKNLRYVCDEMSKELEKITEQFKLMALNQRSSYRISPLSDRWITLFGVLQRISTAIDVLDGIPIERYEVIDKDVLENKKFKDWWKR